MRVRSLTGTQHSLITGCEGGRYYFLTPTKVNMAKSKEFNRDGDPSVKKVVTGTGSLGNRDGSLVEKLMRTRSTEFFRIHM